MVPKIFLLTGSEREKKEREKENYRKKERKEEKFQECQKLYFYVSKFSIQWNRLRSEGIREREKERKKKWEGKKKGERGT